MLPNAVFELGLHVYELAIYAYPLRLRPTDLAVCGQLSHHPSQAGDPGQHRSQVCGAAGGTWSHRHGAH